MDFVASVCELSLPISNYRRFRIDHALQSFSLYEGVPPQYQTNVKFNLEEQFKASRLITKENIAVSDLRKIRHLQKQYL